MYDMNSLKFIYIFLRREFGRSLKCAEHLKHARYIVQPFVYIYEIYVSYVLYTYYPIYVLSSIVYIIIPCIYYSLLSIILVYIFIYIIYMLSYKNL